MFTRHPFADIQWFQKSIKVLIVLTLITHGSLGIAVEIGSLKRCAVSLYNKVHKVYDPWTKAALELDLEHLKQPHINYENIVVAPLWKMRGTSRPLEDLAQQLDDIKASGVTTLYFPPMYPQMLYDFFGSPNNHGYWPKSFDLETVDSHLGTSETYLGLLKTLRNSGLRLALDIVPRHIGYAPADGKVELWGRKVSTSDPLYFAQTRDLTPLDYSDVLVKGPEMLHLLTDLKPWGLPYLNLENSWVRNNMIRDHVRAVEMGFTTFRIDSVKHMRSDYVRDLIRALSSEGHRRMRPLKFILEYFSGNYGELAYKLHEIEAHDGMMFIDFRMSGALRESVVDGNSFAVIRKAIQALEELKMNQAFLIQAITDQDGYYHPIYHGTSESEDQTYATMILAHMTSTNRPYYVAGIEQPEPQSATFGQPQKFFDQSSPIAGNISQINDLMNEFFPKLQPFKSGDIIEADKSSIVILRKYKSGGKGLIMVIDRSGRSRQIERTQQVYQPIRDLFRWGQYGHKTEVYLAEVSIQ